MRLIYILNTIIALILTSNSAFCKKNYKIQIVINSKLEATDFISLNSLFNDIVSIKGAKYAGTTIDRLDLPLSHSYTREQNLNFNDEIISLGNVNCYDSTTIRNQYLNCYISNSGISDKIFNLNGNINIGLQITSYINSNKPKTKKNYLFVIFYNTSKCNKTQKSYDCPNLISLINEAKFCARCKTSDGDGAFLFKWISDKDKVDIKKFKFYLTRNREIVQIDSLRDEVSKNIILKNDTFCYLLDGSLEKINDYLVKNNLNPDKYNYEFRWHIEYSCSDTKKIISAYSSPIQFLKCPDVKEALPCNEE